MDGWIGRRREGGRSRDFRCSVLRRSGGFGGDMLARRTAPAAVFSSCICASRVWQKEGRTIGKEKRRGNEHGRVKKEEGVDFAFPFALSAKTNKSRVRAEPLQASPRRDAANAHAHLPIDWRLAGRRAQADSQDAHLPFFHVSSSKMASSSYIPHFLLAECAPQTDRQRYKTSCSHTGRPK